MTMKTKTKHYFRITGAGIFEENKRRGGVLQPAKNQKTSWYYLGFIGEIGFSLALPIAIGAIVGSVLDRQWQIYPWATLSLLLLGLFLAVVNLVRIVTELIKK